MVAILSRGDELKGSHLFLAQYENDDGRNQVITSKMATYISYNVPGVACT